MIDTSSLRGRIIKAALEHAAEKPWADITLLEIAARAGSTLPELRNEFDSKGATLRAFAEDIDDIVLMNSPDRPSTQSARDTVFEVVMSRFDALEPYKTALKSIHAGGAMDPAFITRVIDSQRWMLNAAGVTTDGIAGSVRTLGLTAVYAAVFRIWLDDDDPGMAKTMAALDMRLRRGERALGFVDEVTDAFGRMAATVCSKQKSPGQAGPGSDHGKDAPDTATDAKPDTEPPPAASPQT